MDNRNQATRFLSLLCLWVALSGCGTEEVAPHTDHPEGTPSCETLEPLLFQAPLTGSAFHCLWCNREWKWRIPDDTRSLFVLIAVACGRLRSEACLEIRDAEESVVWQREIEQGDDETYCIRQDAPLAGPLSVHLRGTRDLLLVKDLIEEFRGSVYLKVFNGQGDPLVGSDL